MTASEAPRSRCAVCEQAMASPDAGAHPACLAARLPEDALVLAAALAAVVLVPLVVVWAG